jgi:hypothetical protein
VVIGGKIGKKASGFVTGHRPVVVDGFDVIA